LKVAAFLPLVSTSRSRFDVFPKLGPHSFRHANITWRQEVGGIAIEASKIGGHSDLEMTGLYTFVAPERQNELTRRIQEKLAEAVERKKIGPVRPGPAPAQVPPGLADAEPLTTVVQ
jgi:integrase